VLDWDLAPEWVLELVQELVQELIEELIQEFVGELDPESVQELARRFALFRIEVVVKSLQSQKLQAAKEARQRQLELLLTLVSGLRLGWLSQWLSALVWDFYLV